MGKAGSSDTISPAPGPPLAAILLLSGSALGYEVLLVRLLSIAEWHHVVSMVISLALLGYAVSGSVIAISQAWLAQRYAATFTLSALLFAVSAPLCYLLASALPFNALEILWDPWQWVWLALVYLVLSVPFFFAATCIALTLTVHSALVGRVYAADLLGAGLGAVAVLIGLSIMDPEQGLLTVTLVGLIAAILGTVEGAPGRVWGWRLAITLTALASLLVPTETLTPRISPYKGLAQALQIQGAELVAKRSGPHALIAVVANEAVPLRRAPGLSLHSPYLPPDQLAIFEDGEGPTALNRFTGDYAVARYLDWTPAALAYRLQPAPGRVLILGQDMPGALLLAGLHGAGQIDALATDPELIKLLERDLADYDGWRHQDPRVALHHATARGFLARATGHYDLIRLDLGGPGEGGAGALREDYAATVEGIRAMWELLSRDGLIAIGSDLEIPPRLPLKLLATATRSLQDTGVRDPGSHMVLIRGWESAELILSPGMLGPDRIAALREFARSRGFDLAWYPGITPGEANRYQLLAQPWLYQGTSALLGPDRDAYLRQYKFDLEPATDDRPYVFNSFRWAALPELLALRGQGGIGLLEMGYPLLVATLLQAIVLSVLLILAPLAGLRSRGASRRVTGGRWRILVYFLSIGLAFMFIEIAFIQRFVLYLGDPVWATAIVVSAFLVFAGLGSLGSARWRATGRLRTRRRLALAAVLGIVLVAGAYLLTLPLVGAEVARLALMLRLALAYLLLAPLAFLMGMPFPLGLASTAEWRIDLVPWAWAINGCASVIGALLASLVAVGHGFASVVLFAGFLYLVAALAFPAPLRKPAGSSGGADLGSKAQ
jgi:MFS family permease